MPDLRMSAYILLHSNIVATGQPEKASKFLIE